MSRAKALNDCAAYATYEELDFLSQAAADLGPEASVVMIGAGPGVMAVAMLEANRSLHMTIIDNTEIRYAQAHLNDLGAGAQFLLADSKLVAMDWNTPLDFLIVDGDHSYIGVMADLTLWLPHLRPGATVFIHDCYPTVGLTEQPEVAVAVAEFAEAPTRVGTAAVFTK